MAKTNQIVMSDDQIEEFIYRKIKTKSITFNDMIGCCGAVDPDPGNTETDKRERLRVNKFSYLSDDTRMLELLTDAKCSYLTNLPLLNVSLQDLFRFWWNRCVEQKLVVEMILEDIFSYFREEMRPSVDDQPQLDMSIDFDHVLSTKTSDTNKVKTE